MKKGWFIRPIYYKIIFRAIELPAFMNAATRHYEVKQSVVCMRIMPELYRADCFIAFNFMFGKKFLHGDSQ